MLSVMADLRPCLAQGVLLVQSSAIEAYQKAASAFTQRYSCSPSLPGIATIQSTQTVVLDPAAKDAASVVATQYQSVSPEVVVAIGAPALEAVKDLSGPVVYLLVPNPAPIVGERHNITGISMMPGPLPQLTAIKSGFPAVNRIGILFNPAASAAFVALAQEAAKSLELSLVQAPASADREAILLISSLAGKLDAIWLLPEPSLVTPLLLKAVGILSLDNRIPLVSFSPKYLELGAAMAVYSSPEQQGQQAAELAKRLTRTPSQEVGKPEYGRETTVLTNERIIQNLGRLDTRTPPPEGHENP